MTDLSVELPWAMRCVHVGDLLTETEARELIIAQRGRKPLSVVPIRPARAHEAWTFRVEAAEPIAPMTVLERLLGGTDLSSPGVPRLIIDELEAVGRMEAEFGFTAFIPIAGGQMVPRPYGEVSPKEMTAFFEWQERMWSTN
ncbi:hypothetical protein HNQ07_004702 [Deinococcus metalli]|uniref:Uncharacterized protein n=1 Tax=Deinococcus metalli TaxID=1141878 RepID=A0A7W8KJA8_9DEIO|nr:hypothetical protein [Deinococcus metalli]MBB5379187.1 hypothetical protein [Deinococcus metalli]GHF65264.1 hypothetical protein GCM10017781_46250 [Deinococcus metalli]